MAKGSFSFKNLGGHTNVPTITWQTDGGDTDIKAGEFVKHKANGSQYVIPLVTGDFTISSSSRIMGLAQNDSTHTGSADGTVKVYLPLPGIIYRGKAHTSGNFDIQSEIDALVGDRVDIDITGSVWTINENATDSATNTFYIVGGNPDTAEVWFTIRLDATFLSGESVI